MPISVKTDDNRMAMTVQNGLPTLFGNFGVGIGLTCSPLIFLKHAPPKSPVLQEARSYSRRSYNFLSVIRATSKLTQICPSGLGPCTKRQLAPKYNCSNCRRDGQSGSHCYEKEVSKLFSLSPPGDLRNEKIDIKGTALS